MREVNRELVHKVLDLSYAGETAASIGRTGVTSERTAARLLAAFRGFALGQIDTEVGARTGWSEPLVADIRRWYDEDFTSKRVPITSGQIQVVMTKVGPVPDVPTLYRNPLGVVPTDIQVTPTLLGTPAPILVGSVTPNWIQIQALKGCSGAIGQVRMEYDPSVGSVPWLSRCGQGPAHGACPERTAGYRAPPAAPRSSMKGTG